jgi:hypothetical protein
LQQIRIPFDPDAFKAELFKILVSFLDTEVIIPLPGAYHPGVLGTIRIGVVNDTFQDLFFTCLFDNQSRSYAEVSKSFTTKSLLTLEPV